MKSVLSSVVSALPPATPERVLRAAWWCFRADERHLAYELLDGYEAAILVDAAPRGEAPGTVYVIEPDLDGEPDPAVEDGTGVLVDAHGMEPDAVFALLKALGGDIPKLLVVGCEPAEVSERMGLSPPVAGAVDQAVAVVRELLGEHETGEEG